MKDEVRHFHEERERLNGVVMARADREMKRFWNLDASVYRDGALPAATKEILGLVASLVLRCDDCVRYHLARCHETGVTADQVVEAMDVALIVGGSITIPHVRRAMEFWDALERG